MVRNSPSTSSPVRNLKDPSPCSSRMRLVKDKLLSWQLEVSGTIDIIEANHPLVPTWTAFVSECIQFIVKKWPKLKDNWKSY